MAWIGARYCILGLLVVLVIPGRGWAQEAVASRATLAPGLTLHFVTAPLVPEEHGMIYDEEGDVVLDGCRTIYGVDGGVPARYLHEAYVVLGEERYPLDASCMFTCETCVFEAENVHAVPNPAGRGYRISGTFSDGAGTYRVAWLVAPTGTARLRIASAYEQMRAAKERRRRHAAFRATADELRALLLKLEAQIQRYTGRSQSTKIVEQMDDLLERLTHVFEQMNAER